MPQNWGEGEPQSFESCVLKDKKSCGKINFTEF